MVEYYNVILGAIAKNGTINKVCSRYYMPSLLHFVFLHFGLKYVR